MDLSSYVDFLGKVLSLIPFNFFDLFLILMLCLYVFEDALGGAVSAFIGFFSTIMSFFVGLALYHPISELLVDRFSLTKGISDAAGFLIVTVSSFFIISTLLTVIKNRLPKITLYSKVDILGGAIFGLFSFFFIASFAVALLLSFPVSSVIKNSVKSSVGGKFLSAQTQGLENYVKQIFGGAIEDTINFLTVKPSSEESVSLNFKTTSHKIDSSSEREMLNLVNLERGKKGLPTLAFDEDLSGVARLHAKDMLERGYFSHYTPEGASPFDRMEAFGITYQYAGENLAFAPDVQIAMAGLMKSPGHRENILSPNFRKGGIGVIDAGIYGKMFVQEFSD